MYAEKFKYEFEFEFESKDNHRYDNVLYNNTKSRANSWSIIVYYFIIGRNTSVNQISIYEWYLHCHPWW